MPHTRGDEIRQLFDNMAYNEVPTISIDQAITELVKKHDICQDTSITINDSQELAKRLFEIADMVEKDRPALNDIFSKRVPIAIEIPSKDIDLLISFSRYYATIILKNKLWRQVNIDGGTWPENAMSSVYYTLSTIIQNSNIQTYLKHLRFGPRVVLGGQSSIDTAMIVMADADLYSAIRTLTSERVGKTDYLDRPLWYLKKIWIQEPVKEKFGNLIDELQIKDDTSSIKSMLQAFRNKNEVLQHLEKELHIKAVAIWSRDVVTAKNIADAADRVFLVWINSYGEIGPGISLPWTDVKHHNNCIQDETEVKLVKRNKGRLIMDHFYDGAWKEPIDGGYCKDEKDDLWASATAKDVDQCLASAVRGFKKWRSSPLTQRQKCFYRFASRLQACGNAEISESIRIWAECPILYGSASSRIEDGAVEITTTREPKGVVVIACDDLVRTYQRIVCASIAGNSVIVTYDSTEPDSSMIGMIHYCDALGTCGFPPGVINCLSFHDLPSALTNLSKMRSVAVTCTDFCDPVKILSKGKRSKGDCLSAYWIDTGSSDPETWEEKLYNKYTRPKSVWLPLK